MTTTLLTRAADTIEREAELLRDSCRVAGVERDWACRDCAGDCTPRAVYAADTALVRELRAEAERLTHAPDPLGDALNSGDGTCRP